MKQCKRKIQKSAELCGWLISLLNSSKSLIRHCICTPNNHVWYGYYDHNPCNDKLVLFHRLQSFKNARDVDICIYDLRSKSEEVLAQSSAFSSQLATRLSWISPQTIHYNSFDSGFPITTHYNITNGKQTSLPFQFWNFTKTTDEKILYASLNMTRLCSYREGYGYNTTPSFASTALSESNYLRFYLVNQVGAYELLCSLEQDQLLDIARECLSTTNFYLNHALFSPDSSSCVFCIHSAAVAAKDTQLLYYNLSSRTYHALLPGFVVSHHCYISNTELLICVIKDGQTSYIIYDLEAFTLSKALSDYNVDGHPCYVQNRLIIDTYPNRLGIQKLLTSNSIEQSPKEFFSLFSPKTINNGPYRVDFHPRVDILNKLVWIDALQKGYRQLLAVELP